MDNVNTIGCYGLGQDCNDVLATACPDWQTNRACQDEFWNDYAARRYNNWSSAKAYWLCTGYCTNNYGTIYKTKEWW